MSHVDERASDLAQPLRSAVRLPQFRPSRRSFAGWEARSRNTTQRVGESVHHSGEVAW